MLAVPGSSWLRNTATSLFTSALDIGTLTALVELARVEPDLATLCGTIVGASSNFAINRWWSFGAAKGSLWRQLLRFLPVQAGSSALQTFGVWLLAERLGMLYLAAKGIVAVAVYLGWNYPANKYFIFTREPNREASGGTSPPGA